MILFVRIAGVDEAGLLAQLHQAAFGTEGWTTHSVEGLLASPRVRGLIAQQDDRPVGMALDRSVAGEREILAIGVTPAVRRQGVGRALMAEILRAARDEGDEAVFLEVSERNHGGDALYRGFGFTETGRRARYYSDGADALTLALRLAG